MILAVILAGSFSGCEQTKRGDESRGTVRLMLLCGGALRPPVDGLDDPGEEGILARFRSSHPEVTVETSYGASNLLLGQLKLTRAGDLFFPGDDFYIEEAKKEEWVHETRTVARFVPVIRVTAPEVAQAVSLGHADATITWRPVAVQYPLDGTLSEIPPEKNVFSQLVTAVLKTSGQKEAGLMFADFIAGPEGRKVFQRYHYDVD